MDLPKKLGNRPVEGAPCVEVAGTWFGPFEDRSDARGWAEAAAGLVSSKRHAIVTAREVFEETVGYSEAHLLNPFAAGLNMHPWIEVWDVWIRDDNGRVLLDLPSSTAALDPETAVIVSDPQFGCAPVRRLPSAAEPPAKLDVEQRDVVGGLSMPHPGGGEMVVVRWPEQPDLHLCCWRRDRRMLSGLKVFSAHSQPDLAAQAMKTAAAHFSPSETDMRRGVSRREADRQQGLVYTWEASFDKDCTDLNEIQACQAYVGDVYGELGEEKPPAVSLGRPTLERSYYSPRKGIVLAHHALNSLTLLHESAHELAQRECRRRRTEEPGHGPIFVGVVMALYARFACADSGLMASAAEGRGISWDKDALERYAAPSLVPAP